MTTAEQRQLIALLRAKAKKMDRLAQEVNRLVALLEAAITDEPTTTQQEAIEHGNNGYREDAQALIAR